MQHLDIKVTNKYNCKMKLNVLHFRELFIVV